MYLSATHLCISFANIATRQRSELQIALMHSEHQCDQTMGLGSSNSETFLEFCWGNFTIHNSFRSSMFNDIKKVVKYRQNMKWLGKMFGNQFLQKGKSFLNSKN